MLRVSGYDPGCKNDEVVGQFVLPFVAECRIHRGGIVFIKQNSSYNVRMYRRNYCIVDHRVSELPGGLETRVIDFPG